MFSVIKRHAIITLNLLWMPKGIIFKTFVFINNTNYSKTLFQKKKKNIQKTKYSDE